MTAHYDHFINNEWIVGKGKLLTSYNSANKEPVWVGKAATDDEISEAINAGRKAFETWSSMVLEERLRCLETFGKELNKSADKIAEAISKEIGKPLWESKNEVTAMINKVKISAEAYKIRCAEMTRDHPSGKSITRHRPHGLLAVLGPFNFPGHIPNGHIIPALLAGNTVVFKPSEMAPHTAEEMMKCWEKCALPPGVINMIQGGRETGRLLASRREIDGLLFTGSWEAGLILTELFARTPGKILALELGGNNPLIVDDIKDAQAAAYLTIQSAFLTSGQRCTCARRLIVLEGSKGDAFIKTLINMMDQIKVGYYTDTPEPFMGPVISEHAVSHLLAVQDSLVSKGGNILAPMHLLKLDTALLKPGLIDVTNIRKKVDEEVFGPLLQLIRVPDFDAAIKEANDTSYGLTAGLISINKEHYEKFKSRIQAGVISWNAPLTNASSAAPFGGIKRSGNLRPSGFYAADYCSYPVAAIESAEMTLPATLFPGLSIK